MAIRGIAHVQVAITPDGEDAARRFYGGVLGLREILKPDSLEGRGGVWFACGSQEIHCGVEREVAASRRHPAFTTDDIDDLRSSLTANGFPIDEGVRIPGFRRFYTEDPFGNRIEFLQRGEETP